MGKRIHEAKSKWHIITQRMKEEFEIARRQQHQQMAAKVLEVVGERYYSGKRYITTKDVYDHEEEIVNLLLGQVRAWYTATERQRLYKNSDHLGMSLVKLILSSVKHPLKCSACRIDSHTTSNKYSLDQSLENEGEDEYESRLI